MKKILFSDKFGLTEAVLSGRKTQTRRIVPKSIFQSEHDVDEDKRKIWIEDRYGDWHDVRKSKYCFKVGEVVAIAQSYKDCGYGECAPIVSLDENGIATFGSDAGSYNKMFVKADLMPHHIRITNVRVEQLQDISDEDCIKEGVIESVVMGTNGSLSEYFVEGPKHICYGKTSREAYAVLTDRISGKGTWSTNPYVFVYDFELVD